MTLSQSQSQFPPLPPSLSHSLSAPAASHSLSSSTQTQQTRTHLFSLPAPEPHFLEESSLSMIGESGEGTSDLSLGSMGDGGELLREGEMSIDELSMF